MNQKEKIRRGAIVNMVIGTIGIGLNIALAARSRPDTWSMFMFFGSLAATVFTAGAVGYWRNRHP